MRDTWADSATSFTSVKMNTYDAYSDVSSKLLDLKRNGLSEFTINKIGKIVNGTIDIPHVNSLEESITTLSAAGLAQVDIIAANLQILQANTTMPDQSIGLVYADPAIQNNDWYYFVDATNTWANTGLLPNLATQLTPRKQVDRTIYVSMNGSDTNNDGRSIYKPFQTINKALLAANTLVNTAGQGPCVVIVSPGEYEVSPNTEIPSRVTLYGYDARATKLTLAEVGGSRENNMFLLTSGIKVRGFTITGLRHEQSWYDSVKYTSGGKDYASLDYGPPKKGYAFAFKPGAYISRSPYISDCCVLHDLDYQGMSAPQDRQSGNPLVPMTGGNLYADGAILDPDSPLRSVVVDSFTAVNPNGIGYAIVNSALVQLVSVFTNWSRVGIWAHAGGQVTVVNSNATFGDYAFASTGFRYAIRVPGIVNQNLIGLKCPNFGYYIANNVSTIATKLNSNTIIGFPSIPNWTTAITGDNIALSLRDTETILKETAEDLISGQDKSVIFWTQSLFKANTTGPYTANSVLAFSEALKPYFLASWDKIRTELKTLAYLPNTAHESEAEVADQLIDEYFTLANNVISNPLTYTTPFPSKVEAASHQFSYAGSGVNFNALPFGQRASGVATDPTTNLYQSNGGIIYATFNTEQGDTYLGKDLKVDFERSTIEGQAFSRGVQNITLPLIVGIGG
jgi:hypothetical protein